jgi:Leucine-rich repeat (LRR) protein
LSTNNIEKISSLTGMDSLRILSLSRNLIKKAGPVAAWEGQRLLAKQVHDKSTVGLACRTTQAQPNLPACAFVRAQVENVEAVAGTLEELWLSYNSIEKLV